MTDPASGAGTDTRSRVPVMGKAVSLFCRSRGAIVGANLMKHQSGKETVRTDELGTCGVGCLARLLPCRNVRVPGIPPQRFLYPATNWLATAGGLGLQVESKPRRCFG